MYVLNRTLTLYSFRNIALDYGLWDQLRVDQGKEWILMLFVQEQLAHLRRNSSRPPHLQSTSKQVSISLCHYMYNFSYFFRITVLRGFGLR